MTYFMIYWTIGCVIAGWMEAGPFIKAIRKNGYKEETRDYGLQVPVQRMLTTVVIWPAAMVLAILIARSWWKARFGMTIWGWIKSVRRGENPEMTPSCARDCVVNGCAALRKVAEHDES